MKILWTISNWKRTGPVEPSLDLAAAFAAAGHDVRVVLGRPPAGASPFAADAAKARGLPVEDPGAYLAKHRHPIRDFRDAGKMRRYLSASAPDLAVSTLRNDHRLVLRSRAAGRPPVARLWFGDGTSDVAAGEAAALRGTELVVAMGADAHQRLLRAGVDAGRVLQIHPPLDVAGLERRVDRAFDVRSRFEVPAGAFLFGIVARLQTHRRFELLWEAAAKLVSEGIDFHLLVIGRGTHAESVARAPIEAAGLGDSVTLTGYLEGAEYASTLAGLDAQVFLVPGSDPTCRALREGMALGVPSVTTRRGLLPEIVAEGETGVLCDESADALAAGMKRLAASRDEARQLGAAAARRADERYDVRHAVGSITERLRTTDVADRDA